MKRILKRNIYLLLEFAALYIGTIGCNDRVDAPISSGEGKDLVTVPLSFGFAEESFGELYRNGSPQRLAATARRNGSPQRLPPPPPEPVAQCDHPFFNRCSGSTIQSGNSAI